MACISHSIRSQLSSTITVAVSVSVSYFTDQTTVSTKRLWAVRTDLGPCITADSIGICG